MTTLTPKGKAKNNAYIRKLQAKRKEILDAEKDTADNIPIPYVEGIICGIEWFTDEDGDYYNG